MDPILMFSVIMLILLLAPILSSKARLPGIIGLIVTGIIVGPHALGVLKPEGAMELFSQVGLIYLMFLAGLEINLHEFSRQKKYSLTFGSLTFVIPMVMGTLGARYLLFFSWPTAILLASMFASHTLISFPITSRLGINRNKAVISTVGGTIITDTAALLVLAIIAESATKQLTAVFWGRQILLLIALVWFSLWLLPRIASFFFQVLSPDGGGEFILTLALVFFTSHLAHLSGVEPIIGAFFAGLALSRIISEQSPLMSRLEFVGHVLFIPFFLISVGMLVNLRVLFSGIDVWVISIFMVVTALVCKYVAAVIFARIMGFPKDEGKLIFGLSVNQAAATLAAVIVGLRLGIFNEAVLNGTILMILVTCIVGPLFTEKYGRKIAKVHIRPPAHRARGDARIMVGLSREDSLDFLTDVAMKLRSEDSIEPILPLYVVQDGEDIDHRISFGESLLSKSVARIVASDIPVSPISRIDVNIPGGILHALKEWRVDTLVMGSSRYESNLRNMLFRIYDKVREESSQLLFLCYMTHHLNLDKRVLLAIPPMMECQAGFNRAFEAVRDIALGNKMKLTVLASKETVDYVQKVFKKTLTDIPVSFNPIGDWKNLQAFMEQENIQDDDALVILSSRKGRLAWQPSTEKIVSSLERTFKDNNLIVVNPADEGYHDQSTNTCPIAVDAEHLDDRGILSLPEIHTSGTSPKEAVKELLASYFPQDPQKVEEIIRKLSPITPVELTNEIALLHTHTRDIDQPVVLLGKSPEGIVFPGMAGKVKAFFVLISPIDETAVHLQTLAKVAQMARTL
jgi:Kef-type K+ transport system membrane component KefB/mannitol/fructose-specific phosphotransferase system IIA component (Ntr-type)